MLLMHAAWVLQSKAVAAVRRDGVRQLLVVDQLCLAAAWLRCGLQLFLVLDDVVACWSLC
jgi:hypothetical protein